MTDKALNKEKEQKLIELTSAFCAEKLDDEYARLSEKLIKKLGRKRGVPFAYGSLEIWAAGIIHALGSINFLFDKSFEPYVTLDEINEYFGVKKSSSSNKSREIRNMFNMQYFDDEFSTSQMIENNPMNSMVMVDGLIVALESLPDDIQALVRQMRAEGKDVSFTSK